jgi:hypothetical protein
MAGLLAFANLLIAEDQWPEVSSGPVGSRDKPARYNTDIETIPLMRTTRRSSLPNNSDLSSATPPLLPLSSLLSLCAQVSGLIPQVSGLIPQVSALKPHPSSLRSHPSSLIPLSPVPRDTVCIANLVASKKIECAADGQVDLAST